MYVTRILCSYFSSYRSFDTRKHRVDCSIERLDVSDSRSEDHNHQIEKHVPGRNRFDWVRNTHFQGYGTHVKNYMLFHEDISVCQIDL